MPDSATTNILDDLKKLTDDLVAAEPADRAGTFSAFFTLDAIEALAEVWEENEFLCDSLFAIIATVRGLSGKSKAILQSIKGARRRAKQQRTRGMIDQLNLQNLLSESLPDYLSKGLPGLMIPGGFDVDLGGVYSVVIDVEDGSSRREKICSAPIIITRRGRDAESGHMQVEVMWVESAGPGKGRPSWRAHTVERSMLLDARKLTGLIDAGAPVTSVTCHDVVRWLTAFEDINQHKIPLTVGSNRLGWQRNGSFLLPDGHIKLSTHPELTLFPMEGMEPVMKSLKVGGTWEEWLDIVEILRDHPLAMLAIYASVASVLQHIVKCSNYAVDWSNETSSGKTTALRVAASVWGYPADDDDEGFIYSWDTTKVWVERAAGFLHSLPLILDETKRVKNPKRVAETLYDFCSGKGKGRGTLQGVDKILTWNTVLLSTGEQRLTSFTNDGGTRARVLALQGAPIAGPARTAGLVANTVRGRLYAHYGHLGRKVVEYLVFHHDIWDQFRTEFEKRRDSYAGITNTAVGGRLAAYVASIDLARAVCETLGVPAPTRDPIEYLIQAIRDGADDSDRARDAFLGAASWAAMNRHRFWGSRVALAEGMPGSGWVGRWDDDNDRWTEICFEPYSLRNILERLGFIYDEVVPRWGARGWLEVAARGVTRSKRIDGIATACVCMRRDVYEEIVHSERPDVAAMEVADAQLDLIAAQVACGDASWSSQATGD